MKTSVCFSIQCVCLACLTVCVQAGVKDPNTEYAAFQGQFDVAAAAFDSALSKYMTGMVKDVKALADTISSKIQPSMNDMETALKNMNGLIAKVNTDSRNKFSTYRNKLIDRTLNQQIALKAAQIVDSSEPSILSNMDQIKELSNNVKTLKTQLDKIHEAVLAAAQAKKPMTRLSLQNHATVYEYMRTLDKMAKLRYASGMFAEVFNGITNLYNQIGESIRTDIGQEVDQKLQA